MQNGHSQIQERLTRLVFSITYGENNFDKQERTTVGGSIPLQIRNQSFWVLSGSTVSYADSRTCENSFPQPIGRCSPAIERYLPSMRNAGTALPAALCRSSPFFLSCLHLWAVRLSGDSVPVFDIHGNCPNCGRPVNRWNSVCGEVHNLWRGRGKAIGNNARCARARASFLGWSVGVRDDDAQEAAHHS